MKIGITGSTGGLGRRLTEILIERGYSVKLLVRKTSKIENLPKGNIELVYGDITDLNSLKDFIKDIDICFHLAAQVDFTTKEKFFAINVQGTDNICRSILSHNPKCRLIYSSTISVLRVLPYFKMRSSVYGVSKYYAEQLVMKYINKDSLKATIIYPGLMFGYYDRNVIPLIIKNLQKDNVKLVKGGETLAPLIYVDDICDLFIKAAMTDISIGKRYISVKGLDIGIHDFIKIIADKMGYKVSSKIYNKKLLFWHSLFLEWYYKLFKKGEKPPFYRTLVNVFSISYKDYKKVYDDPKKDLGWEQDTSREYTEKKVNMALEWLKNNDLKSK